MTEEQQAAIKRARQAAAIQRTRTQAADLGLGEPRGGVSVNRPAAAELGQNLKDFHTGAYNGLTFGFADEMEGATNAAIAGVHGRPMGDAYRSARDDRRNTLATARERNPLVTGAGDITGGIATTVGALPRLAAASVGRGLPSTVARTGAIGTGEGAVIGAGNADGAPLAANMAVGGAVGGALGVAAPIGAAVVGAPVRGIAARLRGAPNQRAAQTIAARTVRRSGLDLPAIGRELGQAAGEGQPQYMVADAMGPAGQRALAGITRQPGDAAAEIRQFLDDRQLGQNDRMAEFVTDALGAPGTARQTEAAMTDARGQLANAQYGAARANAAPVDVRGALDVIDARLGPMSTGREGIDAALSRYRSRLEAFDNGDPDFSRALGLKQDLQDDIGVAMRAGRGNEARVLTEVQRALDEALEASSPDYRVANDTFRERSRAIDAVEAGQQATRPGVRADDAIDQFRGLNGVNGAQDAFRTGAANRYLSRIEARPPGTNVARDFTTPRNRLLMNEMAQDPALFGRRVDRENRMVQTRGAATGGSQTADNLADAADMNHADNLGMVANLLSGRFGAAAADLGRRSANALGGVTEETRDLIGRALAANSTQELEALLVRAQRTGQSDAVIEAIQRRLGYAGSSEAGIGPYTQGRPY